MEVFISTFIRKIPSKYRKTEDPCVNNMSQVNLQRTSEVETNQGAFEKLCRQKDTLKETLSKAEKQRDWWSEKAASNEASKRGRLFHNETLRQASLDIEPEIDSSRKSIAALTDMVAYRTAPKGAMTALLEKL
jgi:hypothetical protein